MGSLTYKGKRHLPLPKGPYSVGCIDVMTGYSEKGCFMRLYYPSAVNGIFEHHEQWPLWAPTKDYVNAFASVSELPSSVSRLIVERIFNKLYIPAIWDSAPLNEGKPYPLIVFSHGLTACRTTYSGTLVELASHGYIVAAVEHRDQSACYSYYLKKAKLPENSVVTAQNNGEHDVITEKQDVPMLTKSISSEFFSLRNKQVHQRAEECIRALDLLSDINDGNPPKNMMDTNCELNKFRGLFDMSKIALMGHSFGGATALLALSKDTRFRVGLTLDPWVMPIYKEDFPSRLTQPILIISSYGFFYKNNLEFLQKIQDRKTETKCVTIRKTTHMSQSDVPFVIPNSILIRIVRWGLKTHYRDKHIHLDIHNRLMMLFLSKHLGLPLDAEVEAFLDNNSSHIMEGIITHSPSARFQMRWFHITVMFLTLLFVAAFWLKFR